jgi:uncharacterized YccA/Bax inhibitor family protein
VSEQNANKQSVPPKQEGRDKEQADRLRQGSVEFWKIEYDFFKHMMTFSLAAIAAFGAMLGSVFSDPYVWVQDWLVGALSLSRNAVIVLTFSSFIISAVSSTLGMMHAAICVYQLGTLESVKEIEAFHQAQRKWSSKRVLQGLMIILSFGFGLLMFLTFIFTNVRL